MTWRLWRSPNRRAAAADDGGGANWVDVGGLDDLRGNRLVAEVNEISMLVLRVGQSLVAVENECPHLGRRLSDGQVSGRAIRCAAHGYRWDLTTGRSLPGPRGQRRGPLREVPVRLAGDRIMLGVPVILPEPGVQGVQGDQAARETGLSRT